MIEMNGVRRTLYEGDTFTVIQPIRMDGDFMGTITSPVVTVERIGEP